MSELNKLGNLQHGVYNKKKQQTSSSQQKVDSSSDQPIPQKRNSQDILSRKDSVELSPEAIEALLNLRRAKNEVGATIP